MRRLVMRWLLPGCWVLACVLAPSPAFAQEAAVAPQAPVPASESGEGATVRDDAGGEEGFERARTGLFGRPVRRGGFHLQVGFGVGGGPDSSGIFHTMEIGHTFPKSGYTVALLHTFIQNKGQFGGTRGGPDLIGGWMAEFKAPLFFPELVGKVALGLGGTHEQPDDGGLVAHPGFGASYGLDLHFPVWERFGPTLTVAAMNVTAQGRHHFGVGSSLGVTLF